MRLGVFIAVGAAAGAVAAFDSAAWLAERGDDADAMRLKAAYADCEAKVVQPAENVVFPIEAFPDGTVKSRLRAEKAQLFLDTGLVWGSGVTVEQFKPDGVTREGELKAERCLVDRKKKTGWVAGVAEMTWGDTRLRGRGVYFDASREFVKIFSQTEIRTKALGGRGLKDLTGLGGAAAKGRQKGADAAKGKPKGTNAVARITAERTDYDHRNGVVMFDRNVALDDTEWQMCADRLFVFLEGTNELKRLVALGNVAITNGNRRARCAKATYRKALNRVDMYAADDGGARARLDDVSKGRESSLEGDRITFWTETEQVQVDGPAVTVPGFGKRGLGDL